MELQDDIINHEKGYLDEASLKPTDFVKKKTLLKYKAICAVLLCALVIVSLGLGLGLGLKRGNQEQARSWRCTNFRCGETRIPGSYCSCSDDCLQEKDCCVNYNSVCKEACGTHSKYMRAVYPTKTFPNHYTIVTGLYPESHGIIDNSMYDVNLNKHFSLSGTEMSNPSWWKGQPVWLTAMYQNLKAGTLFWPGSDVPINGTYPTLYELYNGSMPYEQRISKVLKWLDNTKSERPDFYTLYIEEPDSSGHSFGPVSGGVIKALQLADQALGMLMEGLKQRNLHKCVNLIVLADHGMDMTYCKQLEYMTNYFKQIDFYMYAGPAARIRARNVPDNYFTFDSEGIVKNLTCKRSPQHFKPYLTPDLPKRFHYANNIRIDKVHLLVDQQWLAVRDGTYTNCDRGNHGYNNEFKSMEISDVSVLNERLNLTTEDNFSSPAIEQYDALLTSNIVPMYRAFRDIWDYFHNVLLQEYARERNGVNVVSGPVFDYNYDGHFDTLDEIKQHVNNTEIPVPTHYFVVLTSCKDKSYTPLNCSGSLNASSFIIPHRPDNSESCAVSILPCSCVPVSFVN
ncbi:hypothetical protein Q9233_013631 [Columba guinea]|nr:hypothetical protein Q9233_013631 [Columba guinea]